MGCTPGCVLCGERHDEEDSLVPNGTLMGLKKRLRKGLLGQDRISVQQSKPFGAAWYSRKKVCGYGMGKQDVEMGSQAVWGGHCWVLMQAGRKTMIRGGQVPSS